MENEDPAEVYGVDLFTGERPPGPDREMALAYVRMAEKIAQMSEFVFCSKFGRRYKSHRSLCTRAGRRRGWEESSDLHQRHAASVCKVFDAAIALRASDLRKQALPPSCLLRLKIGHSDPAAPGGFLGSRRSRASVTRGQSALPSMGQRAGWFFKDGVWSTARAQNCSSPLQRHSSEP